MSDTIIDKSQTIHNSKLVVLKRITATIQIIQVINIFIWLVFNFHYFFNSIEFFLY